MPFEGGRSWARGIERGISGLSHYMAAKKASVQKASKSGQGIQVRGAYHSGAVYRPTKYISHMINNFIQRLKGRKVRK